MKTSLVTSRSVFETVIALNMQWLQFYSQSLASFLIQKTLTKKGILSSDNTKSWEWECYDTALCIVNVDIKIPDKSI